MRSQPPFTTTTTGGTRRRRGVLASVAVGTLALGVLAAVPAQAAPVTVDVYGINDFHGRLERGSAPRPGEQGVAGAAAMAAVFEQYREKNANSIFVSSGDNIGASTFTSFIQDDAPTLTALNQMGLDVSAIGNHEFDKGQDDLRERVEPAADFDYLAANVVDASGEPAFDAYSIVERGGKKIAFIGAVTELMPELVSPAGIEGLEFTDIAESVNRYATALTNGVPDAETLTGTDEADAVVLLVHEGGATAEAPVEGDGSDWSDIVYGVTPEVDAILSAHTHQLYDYAVTPTGGTTPRPVVQTGSYGGALSHLSFTFDSDDVTVKSVASAGTIDLYEASSVEGFVPDAEVERTVADAVAFAAVEGAREIGTVTSPFRRAVQSDGSENRGGESTIGNLVADVQLEATRANGAQMAFMNPGGLRADLAGGDGGVVTFQQAAAVQPFANTLVVVDMTGADVKAALEQQWQPATASRPFLKLGASQGVAYTYDPTAAQGERITSLTLDGAPIEAGTSYKVTVNSFLASGGDNFGAFDTGSQADSGTVDLQAQVDWFQAVEGPVSPDLGQRAVGVSSPDGARPDGYQVGDTITVDLSSLVFSDATGPDVLDVALGGDALGQVPLDRSIVDTTDEQGRAQLQLDVVAAPEAAAQVGVAALRELQVTVPGTDTVVTIAADVPEGVSLVLANALPVDPPVVDPGTPAPVDPTVPGVPADPTDPAAPGAGGPGSGSAGSGTSTASRGPLAYTGSELASGGLLAALALLLTGAGVLTATRLRRRREVAAEGTSTD
ncbi:bifunctional metallophosphatase/5'-nucleotidase [Frigoribacterium salinisoli]